MSTIFCAMSFNVRLVMSQSNEMIQNSKMVSVKLYFPEKQKPKIFVSNMENIGKASITYFYDATHNSLIETKKGSTAIEKNYTQKTKYEYTDSEIIIYKQNKKKSYEKYCSIPIKIDISENSSLILKKTPREEISVTFMKSDNNVNCLLIVRKSTTDMSEFGRDPFVMYTADMFAPGYGVAAFLGKAEGEEWTIISHSTTSKN